MILIMLSAALLREARLRSGLTQRELAQRASKAPSAIGRWERGEVRPTFETLVELIESAGFDLDYSLTPIDPHDRVLIRRCLMLSPPERLEQMVSAVRAYDAMAQAAQRG